MSSVKLENTSKVFDEKIVAVKDFSLQISDKEFIVLVGPSGCGKSTILRMIAGLEEMTNGNVYIDDKKVNDISPKDRDVAMVFQNYALYPHMSVYDNLAFGLKMRKYNKSDINNRVQQAAEILNIQDILDRKPKALSGGQRQRVALGRAIVRQPKVFLFDEPLSNLDANLRAQMRTEISRLHKQIETTMIYVTHDQVEAMSMGDRIVVMDRGIIQQVDSPLNIYNKPSNYFVAGFIGSPTMNFFEGRLSQKDSLSFEQKDNHFQLEIHPQNNQRLRSLIDADIILGIRPEHITSKPLNESSQKISALIQVTEPVGNEIFVYFTIGKSASQYVSRIQADSYPQTGKLFDLYFDTSKLHFFDLQSGKSI